MIEWLGIGHLFELSGIEAIVGFLAPLAIWAAFFVVHLILPGKRVPGHLRARPSLHLRRDPRTPRLQDDLGGILVYGWLYILPLWGMAVYPDPGFAAPWRQVWLIGAPALFLVGWSIARGANMQKYTFKRWPDRKFLGLIEPEYIEAGDRKILCSGLWGVARHFNYLGEGFFSLSIALVFGYFTNLWAWTYFIFIVGLFISRQRLDDKFCEEKYGSEKWAEYQARVKYRIIPGVY